MAAALNTVRLIGTSRAFSSRRCAVTVISCSASSAVPAAASAAITPAPWDAPRIAAAPHRISLMRSRRRESRACVINISQYLCYSTVGAADGGIRRLSQSPEHLQLNHFFFSVLPAADPAR